EPLVGPGRLVEVLPGRLGGPAGAHRLDVALGGPQVPPAPAPAVGVGGAAEPQVVALLPVEEVVAALVAGPGPVRDLVAGQAGGGEQLAGEQVLVGLVVVVGVAGGVGG